MGSKGAKRDAGDKRGKRDSAVKDPILPIMLHAPLLLSWFSREQGVYCFLVLFALQTIESSEFSTSQKWSPSYHSAQYLMGNIGSLSVVLAPAQGAKRGKTSRQAGYGRGKET